MENSGVEPKTKLASDIYIYIILYILDFLLTTLRIKKNNLGVTKDPRII